MVVIVIVVVVVMMMGRWCWYRLGREVVVGREAVFVLIAMSFVLLVICNCALATGLML